MFSFTLRFFSYMYCSLIALVSILFCILIAYLVIDSQPFVDSWYEAGVPLFLGPFVVWLVLTLGVIVLGPLTLICANFFQQSEIIKLLEAQNVELILARHERSSEPLDAIK